METLTEKIDWTETINKLGPEFAQRSVEHDLLDTFVSENYDRLKQHRFLAAIIPAELGGGNVAFSDMCALIKQIAHYDSSTALALSMHNHLLAANVWKYKRGQGGEELLRKVADQQIVLISTGANDWLESSGKVEKTEGGFLVSGLKDFASQSVYGDILVTSAPFLSESDGWQVLHFGIPMKTQGVSVLDNWYTMGMRGTGSCSVKLENVFVPDSAIVLKRPRGEYHPVWNVVLGVAMPLIMSAYVGIAEKAAQLALDEVKGKQKAHIPFLVGEMNNELTIARVLLNDMIRLNDNFNFPAADEIGQGMLTRKTLIAKACIKVVELAIQAVGGKSYYRSQQLERLFRDVQAGSFHPLPEKIQQNFTGEHLIRVGEI